MLAIVAISLKIGEAIDFRTSILTDKRAGTMVKTGNTQVEWTTFIFDHALPGQIGRVDYELVTTRTSTLWGALYLLGGLAGGIAAIWLSAAGIRPSVPADQNRGLPQLASSGVAGVLIYLILRLPAPAIAKFISISTDSESSSSPHTLLGQFIVLAVLAGLFTSAFFGQLEKSFRAIMKPKQTRKKE
jgi:membrane associated rhomboid family serine protease